MSAHRPRLIPRDRRGPLNVLFMNSIGRTDLPGGDTDTLLRSIHEQLLPLGDAVKVYCGHGPDTTIGQERKSNPFLR